MKNVTQIYPNNEGMAPIQAEYESFLSTNPSIETIIKHKHFPQIINLAFGGYHPYTGGGQIDEYGITTPIRTDTSAVVNYTSLEAQEHAKRLRDRILLIVRQHQLRYAGGDGTGGTHGRVQIMLNGEWVTIKGLSDRNFQI